MTPRSRILAGTALALLMASPLTAAPLTAGAASASTQAPLLSQPAPVVMAQADDEQPADQSSEEALPRKKRKAQEAPAEAVPADESAQPRKKHRQEEQRPAAEAPVERAPAPAEEPMQPRKKGHKQAAEQPAATEGLAPAPAEAPAEAPVRKKKHSEAAEPPASNGEAAPAPLGEQPAEAAPEKPRKKKAKEAPATEQRAPNGEAAPAPLGEQPAEAAPATEQPATNGEAAPAPLGEQPAEATPEKPRKKKAKEAPATEQPTTNGEAAPAPLGEQPAEAAPEKPRKKGNKEAPAAEQPATNGEAAPAPLGGQPAEAAPEKPRKKKAEEAPAAEQPATNGEAAPAPVEQQPGEAAPVPGEKPAETEGTGKRRPTTGQEQTAPGEVSPGNAEGSAAPAPDSQKAAPAEGYGQDQGQQQGGKRRPKPAEAGPPPADDKAAQQEVQPEKIVPVTAEQGKRVKERPVDLRRQERPKGTEILKEFGDRVIIQLDNQVMVESNERPRMTHGARDVYYEDLPRGRTRETIERGDGTRVVTIRNAYGDVVRRSRITPDGREYVLSYVDEGDYDRVRDWRDPGRDLPPLQLDIPEDDYILTSERARDPDMYYRFLEQPPVERVERLYSIDEVKRSARIRDKTRRIDLDTITFDFGSASIGETEIPRLEGVANAMERILKQNPAETFLIEGHTDAVGSDLANLALSDKRAEAVAAALTNVFGIPPENLATQGYGEQFLKVKTQAPERQNRRVAIRRITPLVAPVASR